MSTLRRNALAGTAVAALLLYTVPANATVVTSVSGPIIVDWSENVTSGSTSATLSGDLVLSSFNFSGVNSVTFNVFVANDTQQGTLTAGQWANVRLTAFGFNTNPDATTISDTSANWDVTRNDNLPGFQTVDVCVWDGSNCSGGGNDGLHPAESATFNITLGGFATDITSIDLGVGATEFAAKFQTGFGSFHFSDPGGNGNPPPPPPPPPPPQDVPEPGSLMLLGAGLVALGGTSWWRRRRQS